MPAVLDPRVAVLISRALDNGTYCARTQMELVRCFAQVFGEAEWWGQMMADEPALAALVQLANHKLLH